MTKVQSQEMAQICKDGVRKTKAQNELSVAVNIIITKGKRLIGFGYVQNKELSLLVGKHVKG